MPSDLLKVTQLLNGKGHSFQTPRHLLPLPSSHVSYVLPLQVLAGPLGGASLGKTRNLDIPWPGANSVQIFIILRQLQWS